jgi:hypothetical protein
VNRIFERAFFAATLASLAGLAAIPVHARAMRARRDAEANAIREVAPRLPSGDLALSGGARWLRFPSLEEPGAAFADGPAVPDPDPAGGMMAPPRELYEVRPNPGAHEVTR